MRKPLLIGGFACFIAILLPLTTSADIDNIIAQSNRTVWVKGWTVGVKGGSIYRSANVSNVTLHGVGNDGATNVSAAVNTIILNMPAGGVVYFPNGVYAFSNALTLDRSDITLRGESTNAVLAFLSSSGFSIGHDTIQDSQADYFWATNVMRGQTNLSLYYVTNLFGATVAPGDTFRMSSIIEPALPHFPFTHYIGGVTNKQWDELFETIYVTAVSGTNITISTPARWDWTNGPSANPAMVPGVRLRSTGLLDVRSTLNVKTNLGIENLTITTTNAGRAGSVERLVSMSMLYNSWMTNVNIWLGKSYNLYIRDCLNTEVTGCDIGLSSDGDHFFSNHAGMLTDSITGCLFENNIFRKQFPPLEYNYGVFGNAFFGNYFPSNYTTIGPDMHNSSAPLNLWEANHVEDMAFKLDGTFGATFCETYFRNSVFFFDFKRGNTRHQVVGNVVGQSFNTSYTFDDMFQRGLPNISEGGYYGDAPPTSVIWPGPGIAASAGGYTNRGILISSTATSDTIAGDFSVWSGVSGTFWLVFEESTNVINWLSSPARPATALTAEITSFPNPVFVSADGSELVMNRAVSYQSGWRVYLAHQGAFQARQYGQLSNCVVHGNLIYTNVGGTVQWDANIADHDLPDSILYPSGQPGYWGTNRWPAIDAEAAQPVAAIPAKLRYAGISSEGEPPVGVAPVPGKSFVRRF